MSERYPGGLITKTPVTPSGPYQTSSASGIWTREQQMYWQKQGLWPTAGNSALWFAVPSPANAPGGLSITSSGAFVFSYTDNSVGNDTFALIASNGASISAAARIAYAQGPNTYVDSSGNIYLGTYNGASNTRFYIAKYNSAGSNTWAKYVDFLGLGFYWNLQTILVDSSGNIYLMGNKFSTSYTFYGLVIVKLDSTGALVWANYYQRTDGTTNLYNVGKACFDASGNLVIPCSYSDYTAGVTVVNSSGTLLNSIGYTGFSGGGQTAAILLSGTSYYMSGGVPSPNQPALLKLDSSFNPVWSYSVNDPSGNFVRTSGNGIALDPNSGSIYIGNFYIYNAPSRAAVAKFTSAGVLEWVRSIGSSTNTTRCASYSSLVASSGLYNLSVQDTNVPSPILFQGVDNGSGTGTAGTYSYNAITTGATAITTTLAATNILTPTSFTPTVFNSTSTAVTPAITKTSL